MSPRAASRPSLPMTPGGWLAAFRYRASLEEETLLTPERLGAIIGISGATIRRWEAGRARPSESDIARVSEVCRLTAIEASFLERAFRAREGDDRAPDATTFNAVLRRVRDADLPVFLLDSFLFVRARNAYAEAVQGADDVPGVAPHPLAYMFGEIDAVDGELHARREAVAQSWLLDFWYWSAPACGTDAYKRMITSLSRFQAFTDKWTALGMERSADGEEPIGGPYTTDRGENGIFRLYPVRIFLPPTYTFAELVPLDDRARASVERLEREQPRAVITNRYSHWSVDPIMPDGTFDLGRI